LVILANERSYRILRNGFSTTSHVADHVHHHGDAHVYVDDHVLRRSF